ncbi:DUF4058 family protein [Limnoglobus roseus]|uniref:DUF4058 domain-containing protein n=1 Tax=Limnoglobus roseus TaxID=2598579 RepID=A0A5C1A4C6_9BACT|nr:DUF4058 family protein [Limnoglobus roseus]QEL13215.1 hypothetical protein PX52LOC_00068 [Limnoglobus roseus]
MPIHDWTRVDSGTFHDFHQGWSIEVRNALNRGVLPPGYFAMADQRVSGPEPDVVTFQTRTPSPPPPGGVTVLDRPPRVRQVAKFENEPAAYARKANRIAVRHNLGRVVAIIEIVSPGNKDSVNAVRSFTGKVAEFLRNGVHVVVIDVFPPTIRDPDGIHQAIWDEIAGQPFEPRPEGKTLTAASYDAGYPLTAYVEPLAVGDELPPLPLFIQPGVYVPMPLEETYRASWDVLPEPIRALVQPRVK